MTRVLIKVALLAVALIVAVAFGVALLTPVPLSRLESEPLEW